MDLRRGFVNVVRVAMLIVLVVGLVFSAQAINTSARTLTTAAAQTGPDGPENPLFLPLINGGLVRDDLASAESSLEVQSVSAGYAHACSVRLDGSLICWGLNTYGQASPPPGTFQQVASGANHSCGLRSDGTLACWGDNTYGQSTPPQGQFTQVTAGGYHACAIAVGGALSCWGWNNFNQLVGIPSGSFTQVSGGNLHTCALGVDGSVSCWGWNADGQSSAPAGAFQQVSAGGSHSCATALDGTATCWGSNLSGELDVPPGRYIQVGAGGFHSCGLTESGQIVCWGSNGFGQLNEIPEGAFEQISVGGQHTCAVRQTGGTLACWGWNRYGQSFPPSGVLISAGSGHACALRVDGQLSCWGENQYGQAEPPAGAFTRVSAANGYSCAVRADGSLACWGREAQGLLSPPAGTFVDVSAGANHACALDINGAIHCWGSDADGKLSPPPGDYSLLSAGANHTCAVRSDGSLACWGSNSAGQSAAPAGSYTQVSAGGEHTCARDTFGQLSCWGSNAAGQSNAETGTFAQVSAGFSHTCGVRAEGLVRCWGSNAAGEINNPRGIFSLVSAGEGYSCTINLDGAVTCWGSAPGTPQIVVEPQSLPQAVAGQSYQAEFSASGGTPPYLFSLVDGALPAGLTLSEQGQLSGAPEADGEFVFTIQAADSGDPAFAGQRQYTLEVLPAQPADTTPPVIEALVSGKMGKNDWYVGPVKVSWLVTDPESPVTDTQGCEPITLKNDTPGVTLTCQATSQGGTASASVTIKIDQTAPTLDIRIQPDVIYLNGTASVEPNAKDNLSGIQLVECQPLDTSWVGKHELFCGAIDQAGNQAQASAFYQVIYKFKGFFPPLENPPVFNRAVAGQTIPIKFQLLDANDQPVTDLKQFDIKWQVIDCTAGALEADLEETYDLQSAIQLKHLGEGKYIYVWHTEKHFANSCKVVGIDLGEGVDYVHTFLVKFK